MNENGQLTVNGFRVKTMPYNIRRSAILDYMNNLHANAAPEDLRQQYALKNPHRPVPYHPKQCCHNILKLCSYATRNDCLDQCLHVIEVYVAELKRYAFNHESALYVAFPFDYEEYNKTLKAPWYSGLSQGFLLGTWAKLYRTTVRYGLEAVPGPPASVGIRQGNFEYTSLPVNKTTRAGSQRAT